jgi:quercetin 2,3-dioxygenase
MIRIRKSSERGHFDFGWLDTYHSFSFGDYYDPQAMGFRTLRVMNEDRVAPGQGFGLHPHSDMEILTYVISGSLRHADSLGSGSVIGPGELQRMTAGTGILHSEHNPSTNVPVHLYQIWLRPERNGLEPSYEQKRFGEDADAGPAALRLLASRPGRAGSLTIHQDVDVYLGHLPAGGGHTQALAPGRHGWVQVVEGALELNGQRLAAGDGAAASQEPKLVLSAEQPARFLFFDLS